MNCRTGLFVPVSVVQEQVPGRACDAAVRIERGVRKPAHPVVLRCHPLVS